MAALLIVAHAPLATALQAVARHVFADRSETVSVVDVWPEWSADTAEEEIRAAVGRAGSADARGEVLILADVFGATPCNAAQRVADGTAVRLVAGLNVPMLWRALAYAQQPIETLIERALVGGSQGVMPASPQRPQDQSLNSPTNDPTHRHHQQ
ncbi:PTS fructose transporter subunit IIA [Ideonella sp. DXS29W]|uniref:PTS fructose transporter subunit IIA n=1 Tax=Ideonella lacteola TaxID=2984193 RepID=A0ABU9BLB1_9BURK